MKWLQKVSELIKFQKVSGKLSSNCERPFIDGSHFPFIIQPVSKNMPLRSGGGGEER